MEIDLSIDSVAVQQTLINFIQGEVSRAGYSHAVINLSGGLDSAVSCVLATRALGAKNILALRLPYKSSSPDSLDHAQKLIDLLGIQSITIPITTLVDPLIQLDAEMSPVRKGNIMARIRMIIAYDRSAVFKGLVVGTGNKTESLLGYTTIYGDSACAFSPIGDLYKTQVRQLARSLSIPEEILAKPPSADLWIGQTDEGELGFTYEEVDKLLHLLIDQAFTPRKCITLGFEARFVHQVVERVLRNHFKHVLPPVARFSDNSEGYDSLISSGGGLDY